MLLLAILTDFHDLTYTVNFRYNGLPLARKEGHYNQTLNIISEVHKYIAICVEKFSGQESNIIISDM